MGLFGRIVTRIFAKTFSQVSKENCDKGYEFGYKIGTIDGKKREADSWRNCIREFRFVHTVSRYDIINRFSGKTGEFIEHDISFQKWVKHLLSNALAEFILKELKPVIEVEEEEVKPAFKYSVRLNFLRTK